MQLQDSVFMSSGSQFEAGMNQILSSFNRNDAVNVNVFDFSAEYSRMVRTAPLASPEGEHEDDGGKLSAVCLK